MTAWILTVCTAGAMGLCGLAAHVPYPTKADCYEALENLYKHKKPEDFRYIICQPATHR